MAGQRNYKKQSTSVDHDSIARELGTVPPQATDVEASVLGAMMIDSYAAEQGLSELTSDSFYDPRHRLVFTAMKEIGGKSAIDIVTVVNRLKDKGDLETVGGPSAIAELTQSVGSAINFEFHVKILQHKAVQRSLIAASYDVMRMAHDDALDMEQLMDSSQSRIYSVMKEGMHDRMTSVREKLNSVVEEIEKTQSGKKKRGVPTGYAELDKISMGWQPGNLIVIGARPGIGKTAIALNLAANASILGHVPVAFFSLEMTDVELMMRLVESQTGITGDKVKGSSKMTDDDWKQLEQGIRGLSECDFYIDDTPAITVPEFRMKAKHLVNTKNVGIIFIDYLQIMKSPGFSNFREEISDISHALKATAKELGVPVIALAQLNRNLDQRSSSNGRPILSDLKESGAIEQDADIVMFVHRPGMMGLDIDDTATEIIVAKNRNGALGSIPMTYLKDIVKFVDPNIFSPGGDDFAIYESGMNSYTDLN